MFDFANLLEFSHQYCVAICGTLIPISALATFQTIVLAGLQRSRLQIWMAVAFASLCVLLLLLHVLSWFVVGVVAAQTYLILCLGSLFFSVNLVTGFYPQQVRKLLVWLGERVLGRDRLLAWLR